MNSLKLFLIFSKVSSLTIGGGYAMIPVIEDFLVKKDKILNEEEFLDIISKAQTVPGVIAINTAILLGYKLCGVPGAIAAILGSAVPPFIIVLIIASLFNKFSDNKIINGFFLGARVGVTVILSNLCLQLLIKYKKNKLSLVVTFMGALSIVFFHLPSVLILFVVAIIIIAMEKGKKYV
ncbi:MAG: chromate transporter [Kosmotogales bacterium]|nr:chromate transporter [Kosmotogales bacterium]